MSSERAPTIASLDSVIAGPDQATPQRLTQALTASGALTSGAVTAVRREAAIEGGFSRLFPLRLDYTPGAPPSSPTRLLLKVPRPDIAAEQTASNGRHEHFFFTEIAPTAPDIAIPRCYGAAITADGSRWHLLLEDLSPTHQDAASFAPPPEPLCTDAVSLLARVHAHWWGAADLHRLRPVLGALREEGRMTRVSDSVSTAVAAFLDFVGDEIAPRRRIAYLRLAAVFPRVFQRLAAGPETLLHGDAHWRNFLYPRDRAAGSGSLGSPGNSESVTYLFDWQSCFIGPPAHDLAYMLVRHWHPEPRRDLLDRLLDTYHAALVQGGVTSYTREQLMADFAVGALRQSVTPPTNWYRWGRSGSRILGPAEWASRLERFLAPLDALGWMDTLSSFESASEPAPPQAE